MYTSIMATDEPLKPYKYQPIHPKGEIRILVLLPPASLGDPQLRGELMNAKISDNPVYEALSYCWGKEVFPETLYLPSGTLAITENLAAGLRRLRYPNRTRHLWVDAVCINQQDNAEKGHQVSLMAQVYKNAECVVVWLGRGSAKTRDGIKCLKELAESAWKYGVPDEDPLKVVDALERPAFATMNAKNNGILVALQNLPIDQTSLQVFFRQGWFNRLWVVQEFVMAKRVDVYNGPELLSWKDLEQAIAVLFLVKMHPIASMKVAQLPTQFALTAIMSVERRDCQRHHRSDLLMLLNAHQMRRCKLAVDLVYGLSALVENDPGSDLHIDYSLSPESVFTHVARGFLRKGNLNILRYGHIGQASENDTSKFEMHVEEMVPLTLPSWVPDWRGLNYQSDFGISGNKMQAATKLPPKTQFDKANPNIIGLEGYMLDMVELSLSSYQKSTTPGKFRYTELPPKIAQLLDFRDAYISKMKSSSYPNGEEKDLDFVRCLMLDNLTALTSQSRNSLTTDAMLNTWIEWYECLLNHSRVTPGNEIEYTSMDSQMNFRAKQFEQDVLRVIRERSFIITKLGYIGIAPHRTLAGDVVSIFSGDFTAFVLRQADKDRGIEPEDHSNEQSALGGAVVYHGNSLAIVIFMDSWIMKLPIQNGKTKDKPFGSSDLLVSLNMRD